MGSAPDTVGGAGRSPRTSSTYEFHSPHSGQRPSHFGETAPHDWQANTVVSFARASGPSPTRSRPQGLGSEDRRYLMSSSLQRKPAPKNTESAFRL